MAHAGLDHLFTVADIWRGLPLDDVVRMRWWRVPAAEVPRGIEAQVDWLYGWWETIDDWVDRTRGRTADRGSPRAATQDSRAETQDSPSANAQLAVRKRATRRA